MASRSNLSQRNRALTTTASQETFKKIHDDNESYAEEQADPYTHVQRKKAILCLVNVNTRYAFARLTKFKSDAELKTAENHI